MSRRDRFFIAKSLLSKSVSCDILPCVVSDHDFITLQISFASSNNRAGVWRLNNSLLSDSDFKSFLSGVSRSLKSKLLVLIPFVIGGINSRLKFELLVSNMQHGKRIRLIVNGFFLLRN